MANTTVGAQVQVEFASIGQMRRAIKDATSDLIVMQQKFGETSPQAIQAARNVAELRDRIGDAKAMADAFSPDKKFVALGGSIQGAVAGFSALQGAIGLFGNQSKEVEQVLLKVQSAMALQQGISGIANAMDSFKLLAGIIKNQVVAAFSTLRGALMATGIGALGIALTAIIANFESFKKTIFNLIPGLESITNTIGSLVTRFTDFVGLSSQAERSFEAMSKSASKTNAEIDRNIKLLEAQGNNEEQIFRKKIERIDNELDVYRKNYATRTAESIKAFEDLKNEREVLIIEENNRLKKLEDERIKNEEDALKKSEEETKKIEEKATADRLQRNAERQRKLDEANKVLDDARRAKLTQRQIEEEDVERAFIERKKTLQLVGKEDFTSIEEQKEIELKAIRDKYKAIQDEADNKALEEKKEADLKEAERLKEAHENTLQMVQQQNQALLNAEIELQNQRYNAAQAGLQLLESLAGENEKIANVIFAVQKGLEIARIVTDTARGIVAAKAGLAAVPPFIGVAPNPAFILAAASAAKQIAGLKIAAAVSIAQIAGASIQRFKRGGSAGATGGGGIDVAGGGGAPVAAQPTPTVTAQALNAQAINQLGNQGMRAYVLNSDITNNEQRNAYLQRNARIG